MWAFDSLQELPAKRSEEDDHPIWNQQTLATSVDRFHEICALINIPRSEYSVVPGFYKESLAKFENQEAPREFALAYIDCDLFSSTCGVLDFLMPRLKHGMIIAFDDYFCWSATQISGERKAMFKYFKNNESWTLTPYMQYGWGGMSFVVKASSLLEV